MVTSSASDDHRLFFALWPDEAVRAEIQLRTQDAVQAAGGRPVPARNFHITLLFMGNVPQADLDSAQIAATAIANPGFDLRLDLLECPPRGPVLWLGVTRPPQALITLVQALRASITAVRTEYVYRPHVTLVRNPIQGPRPLQVEPVSWPAREFVLARSQAHPDGAEYTVLARWPLQG